jgi:ABC-type sulfate/molybdate transport systems ATPase subunit
MSIEVQNITKTFGTFTALRDVSLTVPTGELVALLGPSGSGKTTLLRIIAGLDRLPDPDSGKILFHDEDVVTRGVGDRQVGFVFQHYALFRHMTVFENIAFGLRVRPRQARPAKPRSATGCTNCCGWCNWRGWGALPLAALRRPAAARGPGPRSGGGAEGAAAR